MDDARNAPLARIWWFATLMFGTMALPATARAAIDPEDCTDLGGDRLCISPDIHPWRYSICENLEAYPGRMATWCAVGGGTYGSNYCTGDAPISGDSDMVDRAKRFETLLRTACSVSAVWTDWGVPVTAPLCKHPGQVFKGDIEVSTSSIIHTSGVAQYNHETCDSAFDEDLYGMRDRAADCPVPYEERVSPLKRLECVHPTCTASKCAGKCSPDAIPVSLGGFSTGPLSVTRACPATFGGEAGFTASIQTQTQNASASCGNGCVAADTIDVKNEATILLCGAKGGASNLGATLEGAVDRTTKYATDCERTSCSTICDASRSCKEETGHATVSGGGEWNVSRTFSKKLVGGVVAATVSCEGVASLKAGGRYDWSSTTNQSFPGTCDDCSIQTFAPQIAGAGKGGCALSFGKTPGVRDAGTAGEGDHVGLDVAYSQEFIYKRKRGQCGSEDCLTSNIQAKIDVDFSSRCMPLYGRGIKVGVKARAEGACSGSSCDNATGNGCTGTVEVDTIAISTCKVGKP